MCDLRKKQFFFFGEWFVVLFSKQIFFSFLESRIRKDLIQKVLQKAFGHQTPLSKFIKSTTNFFKK
jgi:hypothetical protein